MVAYVSHFYGGTPDYWLDQPAQTFFAYFKEATKIEARQFSELADIALEPRMNWDYFLDRKRRYEAIIDPSKKKLPPKPGGPVLKADSQEAVVAMRSVGVALKKAMGYGGRV